MNVGWTGGQYSIYRALLAAAVAVGLVSQLLTGSTNGGIAVLVACFALGALGTGGCFALAAGYSDRIAAIGLLILLAGIAAFLGGTPLALDGANLAGGIILLALHAATPRAPFGSWQARERPDPGGDWRMPGWIPSCAWTLLGIVFVVTDLARVSGSGFSRVASDVSTMSWVGLLFDVAFLLALFDLRLRPAAWIAMSIWRLAWTSAFGPMPGGASSVWLLLLLAFDPGWIPSRAGTASTTDAPPRLFYDGECGLCHRAVRFILSEDARGPQSLRIRFSPIGSDAYTSMLAATPTLNADDLPDSIVLELEDGRILIKASAALEIASRLGGLWRIIGFVVRLGGFMPIAALDTAYDAVAKVRKQVFAQPKDSCPILPAHLRARFEL